VRRRKRRSQLDGELASVHRHSGGAFGEGNFALSHERRAHREEVLDGKIVLERPDPLLLVVRAPVVALADELAARRPVHLDVGAPSGRHQHRAVGGRQHDRGSDRGWRGGNRQRRGRYFLG